MGLGPTRLTVPIKGGSATYTTTRARTRSPRQTRLYSKMPSAVVVRSGNIRRRDDQDRLVAVIPSLDPHGRIPPGRFRTTVPEVEQRFITAPEFAPSATREAVWSDFLDLVGWIHRLRVRTPAAFLGGGFTTDSMNPSDVDASILIDASRISSPKTWQELDKIMSTYKAKGLKLDAFLIRWFPEGDQSKVPKPYLEERGKWDDWWQRFVAKHDRLPHQRHHAMPIRGYLEVILDGYT
jgi:hypothetical protein